MTRIEPEMRMADLVFENPALLLLLENLEMSLLVRDHTVAQICLQENVDVGLFLLLANLYNRHFPSSDNTRKLVPVHLKVVLRFLKNCHRYYKEERYPEIKGLIDELHHLNSLPEIKLVGEFFAGYFEEVVEHLDYEDKVAFPYICRLLEGDATCAHDDPFSVKDYQDHHTDIESKLSDLKALLLQHIGVERDQTVRRRLLISLSELEKDLYIHALIEEKILIPVVAQIEIQKRNEG